MAELNVYPPAPRMIWGYLDSNGEHRPKTRISNIVFFHHPENIRISDNVFVGHYSILDGTGGLEIQEGVQIAGWAGLYTHSSHIAIRIYGKHYPQVPEKEKVGYQTAPVKIEKYVFVGAGSKIFPGVTIGKGSIVSANSVVTKDIPPFSIVRGNPAEIVGDVRNLDKRFLEDKLLRQYYEEWQ